MAKCIMIQGTQSDAGKSLIAAGLCRIFRQDGYKAVPFKSQNMSLNAYVTEDGQEMSIAQAIQAQAAGLEPDVRMNPIMLKPTSLHETQVILNGEALWTLDSQEYYRRKKELLVPIKEAYDALAADADIMVIEGAGSPSEINLSDDDIVNMGIAALVDAPVLLVANIDLGGVFGSIYGNIMLQKPEDQARFKGTIINKFRGDADLLKPGLDQIEELTGVPVVGVVPFTPLDIEDEDSVAISRASQTFAPDKDLDIAILVFPWIHNFSDFKSLEVEEDVSLRCVFEQGQIGHPDLLILPDSRSFARDLEFLKDNAFDQQIRSAYESGSHILGIGGGGFLLAQTICERAEKEKSAASSSSTNQAREAEASQTKEAETLSAASTEWGQEEAEQGKSAGKENKTLPALGLLPLHALYQADQAPRKLLVSTSFLSGFPEDLRVFDSPAGVFLNEEELKAFAQAHLADREGQKTGSEEDIETFAQTHSIDEARREACSDGEELKSFAQIHQVNGEWQEPCPEGAVFQKGRIIATGFHGLFDNSHWRRSFLNDLRKVKGLPPIQKISSSYQEHKEREFDRLADLLRQSLDMEAIYKIAGLSGPSTSESD